jgi:hypothetical protein
VPGFESVHSERCCEVVQVSAPALEQSRSKQLLLVQLVQPEPCVVAHHMQEPIFDTVQPSRYSSLLQVSAPLVEQSRVKHTLLVQLVQPSPCASVSPQFLHDPVANFEQPFKYWCPSQVPMIDVQSRAVQVLTVQLVQPMSKFCTHPRHSALVQTLDKHSVAVQLVQPEPCLVSHNMHEPALRAVQPSRY